MVHEIVQEQLVPRGQDEVFAYFAQPENLAKMTPPWLDFHILTPSPVPMREGALIEYLIRLGPLPTRWRTLISEFAPPTRFVDEQLAGPYSFWHHTHEFLAVDGGTLIRDRVRYLLPFGPLGRVAHALVVKRQLAAIFAYRRRAIDQLFQGEPDEGRDRTTP